MEKRVAIVTGGTGGIGSSICQRLTEENLVIACYFKEGDHEKARLWQVQQKNLGYEIDILYADLRDFSECEALTAAVMERYGRIDILVNNAGITEDVTLKKMSAQQWHKVIDDNLHSVFNITRNVLPAMLENNYGRIVTISSINGRKGQPGQCNYAASKSALFGFSKSLAQEVASKGITVNTVSPGYIKTPMLADMRQDMLDSIIARIPVGRLGRPEEVAQAVAFFADVEAAFITGANLDINGGQYM